jgi:F0F1-type ATP synthase assembly protein I
MGRESVQSDFRRGARRFMKGDPKEWAGPLRLLLTVGWYVSLSVIMPVGIGYWLDRPEMFNKSPLFTLVGLGVGTFISFFGLIQILLRYKREQDALNQKKEKKTE